jgi:2-dehydro-3-deoxygalactonokinase
MAEYFISCDWGTSSFRLRLIESRSAKVLAEVKDGRGIAEVHRQWLNALEKGEVEHTDRQAFYTRIIGSQLNELRSKLPEDIKTLEGIPVLLSGMASSNIGLIDMAYKEVPFSLDGSDLNIHILESVGLGNQLVVISGACTVDDVMRGEETKVLGCASLLTQVDAATLVIPGTHPKHIFMEKGKVTSFKSYMTGEFFDLLAGKSILSGSVKGAGALEDDPLFALHFAEGVEEAMKANILHSSFLVRTRQVLKQVPAELNYFFLSGLLIGTELKDLRGPEPIYLISTGLHTSLYLSAASVLGITVEKVIDADEALIRGQGVIHRLISS